jgi:protein phosphatase PTC2/3
MRMEAAVVSEKGIRQSMEDAYYLDLNFGDQGWVYGGVYDGHSGDYAARYASEKLHLVFFEKLLTGLPPGQAHSYAYEAVSQELMSQDSGTTAVDFLIQNTQMFIANAGDARAIVVSKNGVLQLTVDHRMDNREEQERVTKMGAFINYPYVTRGDQGLMPTRSIGDRYFKPVGVVAAPYINEYLITQDDMMLIAACDGLWDFMTNQEVAAMAREYPEPLYFLDVLMHEVMEKRMGTDNLTIIAVALA